MRIDHIIYATRELDGAAERIEALLGLAAAGGGRHEGMGTHNRIVPLGDGFLELLAVCDEEEGARAPLRAAVRRRVEACGEGLMGWAVEVDDLQPVVARLGTSVTTITRQGMTARLAGVEEALREPCLPFFIARGAGVADPGGVAGAPAIGWIEVAGDAARIEQWLGAAHLPVRVVAGTPAVLAVAIGDRELRTG